MNRRSILIAVVAVLGLALSAALAWSASQLAGQRIGLASEPLAVTQGLAPHQHAGAPRKPGHDDHGKISSKPAPKQTATSTQIFSTSTTAPPPVTPAAPAPPATTSTPPAATGTTASSSATSGPSSGAVRHQDDHHPDD